MYPEADGPYDGDRNQRGVVVQLSGANLCIAGSSYPSGAFLAALALQALRLSGRYSLISDVTHHPAGLNSVTSLPGKFAAPPAGGAERAEDELMILH